MVCTFFFKLVLKIKVSLLGLMVLGRKSSLHFLNFLHTRKKIVLLLTVLYIAVKTPRM